MDQILKDIGNAISSFFSNEIVVLGFRAIAVYVVILWLAAAYWAFRDMQTRSANPILPYVAATLVILFTPLFFAFAVVVYRVVRPPERLGEAHEREIAQEAMLTEIENVPRCPGCDRRVEDGWLLCPTCRTRLKRVCPNCQRLVGLDWSLCAWCGRDFERAPVADPYGRGVPAGRPQPTAAPVTPLPVSAASAARRVAPQPAPSGASSGVAPAGGPMMATPMATPMANPMATPMASPMATPATRSAPPDPSPTTNLGVPATGPVGLPTAQPPATPPRSASRRRAQPG